MNPKQILETLLGMENSTLDYLILQLLKKEKLNINRILSEYEESIKAQLKEQRVTVASMAIPLAHYYEGSIIKGQKDFIKAKSAWNLLKVYDGTKFGEELKKVIKQFEYSEDENGHHSITK